MTQRISRRLLYKITQHGLQPKVQSSVGILIGKTNIALIPLQVFRSIKIGQIGNMLNKLGDYYKNALQFADLIDLKIIGVYVTYVHENEMSPVEYINTISDQFHSGIFLTKALWGHETLWGEEIYSKNQKGRWEEIDYDRVKHRIKSANENPRRIISYWKKRLKRGLSSKIEVEVKQQNIELQSGLEINEQEGITCLIKKYRGVEHFREKQLNLFQSSVKGLLYKYHLKPAIVESWFKMGYLSFNPMAFDTLYKEHEIEFEFIATLFSTDFPLSAIQVMLDKLKKPYRYNARSVYFDLVCNNWEYLPVAHYESDDFDKMIDELYDDRKYFKLLKAQYKIESLLGES